LVPRVKSTAFLLYAMYFGLTVLEFICLSIAGMPVFEAINTSFATAGTGGFGFLNDSMASVSPAIQIIITVFMILFGVNFNVYFLLLYRRWKDALRISEVWVYLGIILVSAAAITVNIRSMYESLGEAARNAAFTVGSVITTTGFSTADFNEWPELSRTVLLGLMFIGACAGSTGGGIKVSRFIIMFKTIMKEIQIQVHPKLVKKIKMNGHTIAHESVRSLNIYLIVYMFIFAGSVLILSAEGHDFITNFSAVAATINNIGPGLELVGPSQNFAFFSAPSKIILIFDMLAGRLELFPMLILFAPATWKK
ncbi:MAG: TrkH family potassium uptake protein, partial [Ruminococcus sp.]